MFFKTFVTERLKGLEAKFEVPKAIFFVVFSTVLSLATWLIGGAKLISDLIGFFYPAYMSFKAIDSVDTADNTQWLTYWVVFSLFSIIESTASVLTSIIPFYFYIKCGFFVWLYHPKFQGAQMVYNDVVRPLLLPYLEQAKPAKKTS
jgi:receptor expression-enhancing protein 5/6